MSEHSKMKKTSTVELVILKSVSTASSRTQNRIMEHGPSFFQMDKRILQQSGSLLDGRECILVRSASHSRDWIGWIPLDEVAFITSL